MAFSEYGSRSHFWSPTGTATAADDDTVRLDARKSWVTSAGEANSYVWSSLPLTRDHRRHDALVDTAGLNADVFDALMVLAAGGWHPEDVAAGFDRVQALQHAMDQGRQRRLVRLRFRPDEAAALSALHTRNFI
ncbi:hypothetical protein [Micromonospora sp. NPDC047187]|uniref:hypothetical protein n=1 Tax=Micromonospora sp. NPDC047187 TaxID=3155262 RepID=UPI0033E15A20